MTLEFDFERITLDERNHASSTLPKTPTKTIEPYAPVSPYSDNSPFTPSRSVVTPLSPVRARLQRRDDSFEFGDVGNKIVVSEHKRAEIEGRFKEEPLLKDNPGRFVLFPIQDNEVSMCSV